MRQFAPDFYESKSVTGPLARVDRKEQGMALPDLHFGLFSRVPARTGISDAESFDEFFGIVEESERLGYEAVWIGEEHNEPGVFISGANFPIAAVAASRTSRLQIGLSIVAVPLNHPLRTAEAAATVDQISHGRLIFGAGRSSKIDAYVSSGIDYDESRERQVEGLEVIRKAWTEETFTHRGKFYNFPDARIAPKPFQRPHPPIYYAAGSPASFEVAGREGYNIFIMPRGDRNVIRERVETYHRSWQEAGHAGRGDVVGSFLVYVADTMERAVSEPRESVIKLWERQAWIGGPHEALDDEANRQRARGIKYLTETPYEEHVESDVIVNFGTPEVVAERLQTLRDELGLSGFQLDMGMYNLMPPEQVIDSMSLFAEAARPLIK